MQNINDASLDANTSIVLKALPKDKDFEAILNSLSSAAGKSGVTLGNFEFKVGDLSTPSSLDSQLPNLSMTILINDGARGAFSFLKNLSSSLPLSEIKKVDTNGNYTTVNAIFYYRSLSSTVASGDFPIIPISSKQLDTLSQLSSWDQSSLPNITTSSSNASPSASVASPF
jgi:hypothetical protein